MFVVSFQLTHNHDSIVHTHNCDNSNAMDVYMYTSIGVSICAGPISKGGH